MREMKRKSRVSITFGRSCINDVDHFIGSWSPSKQLYNLVCKVYGIGGTELQLNNVMRCDPCNRCTYTYACVSKYARGVY